MADIQTIGLSIASELFERDSKLHYKDGKFYQRETNGYGESRLVDVTEEVARTIIRYTPVP